jgi:hypothetical protein
MTQQSNTNTASLANEPTPPRQKLPKNYKLPAEFKAPWFMKLPKSEQRMFMLAHQRGEERARSASKRDVETYAESPQNRSVGRNASVAL